MTADRRFEQDLPDLLADIYLGPPPEYRDDILRRVARMPQRPAWTFLERWLPMGLTTLGRQTLAPLPWRSIGLLAVLALLIAAALAVYVGTRPQIPAPLFGPARNGLLAYEAAGDIVVLDPASGRTRLLIGGSGIDSAPAFSRDGTRVAFLREAGSDFEVWVASATGGEARRVASGLAAMQFEAGPTPQSAMEWSPDGGSILLVTGSDVGSSITLVPTDGTAAPRTLDVGMRAEGPTWRPDGEEILFRGRTAAGYGLYAVQPDGGTLRELVGPVPDEFDLRFFGWSPDGSRIVYQRIDPSGPRLLYVAGDDGRRQVAITDVESVAPQWSPEGMRIAFYAASGAAPVLSVAQADGTGYRSLPGGGAGPFQWSPDGMTILQLHESGEGAVLLDTAGGPPVQLSGLAGSLPAWQRLAP